MANIHQILSNFSYGEIDPKLAARADFAGYVRGVKTASNVLSIPQGGFTRRFGTRYVAAIAATDKKYMELYTLIYDDSAIYSLVFTNNSLAIYLENVLAATVVTTYPQEIVQILDFVQVENRLIILHENFAPAQLVRSANAANIITAISTVNDTFTLTNALTAGQILPTTFTTSGTLPSTSPQIYVNTTYYLRAITTTTVRVFANPDDAADNINYFEIATIGTGVNNAVIQNTWTLSNVPFSNLPAYDFGFFPTYSAAGFTFTASATTGTIGTPATITASGAIFTAAMVGGLLIGNGGILRITAFTDSTHVDGITYDDFATTAAFPGNESFLGEPAWSAARGYPRCGTFYQQRLFLAGSREIPNGVWGSTIFAVYDFDDSQSLDDNAISFYGGSGSSNFIKYLTSSKSLIVHSNTGNYSTPLQADVPLTPSNFSLTIQNRDGVSNVKPNFIDNQVIYIDRSANNMKSMAWDIVQSSYVNTNISLPSSHLIVSPVDMAVFSEPSFTDGFYIIAVNAAGNLGIYNSLIEQDVKGWTKADTNQNATAGYFRRIAAGLNRAWVAVERVINGSTVFYLEELDFNYPVDCGLFVTNDPASASISGLSFLNGQSVQIFADGVVMNNETVAAGAITVDTAVEEAYVGLQFISNVEPLPVNVLGAVGPTLYQKQHIRVMYLHFYLSVGMILQGFDVPTQNVQDVVLDEPAIPVTGVYEYTLMEGWNSFDYTVSIKQELPLPFTLLGIGYEVEAK